MVRASQFQFRLDSASGVPVYRQLIDQVLLAIASGTLHGGDQLPTVRQTAIDLAVNPNTVVRAYRELEIRGVLSTQQGIGTYVTRQAVPLDEAARQRRLSQLASECASRAGGDGFKLTELIERLQELAGERESRR